MIKNRPSRAMLILLNIYNNIWYTKEQISQWGEQIIVPFLKPGKIVTYINSYVVKILKQIIKNRLEWYLESENLLLTHQYGYRKRRSTAEALQSLTREIFKALAVDSILAADFLDITGVYDQVVSTHLYNKMLALNLPPAFVQRIQKIISCRIIRVRYKDIISSPKIISSGLAQGVILSTILFNMYTVDLYNWIPPSLKITEYVDDICFSFANSKLTV